MQTFNLDIFQNEKMTLLKYAKIVVFLTVDRRQMQNTNHYRNQIFSPGGL